MMTSTAAAVSRHRLRLLQDLNFMTTKTNKLWSRAGLKLLRVLSGKPPFTPNM